MRGTSGGPLHYPHATTAAPHSHPAMLPWFTPGRTPAPCLATDMVMLQKRSHNSAFKMLYTNHLDLNFCGKHLLRTEPHSLSLNLPYAVQCLLLRGAGIGVIVHVHTASAPTSVFTAPPSGTDLSILPPSTLLLLRCPRPGWGERKASMPAPTKRAGGGWVSGGKNGEPDGFTKPRRFAGLFNSS